MRKLKYVKLFENFQFQYFKPEVIKKLDDYLYDDLDNWHGGSMINYLIIHWIKEIAEVIKSVEPFKNIEEMEVDASENGSIKVDWNNDCRPFTINFSSCGAIKSGHAAPGVSEEYEGISIEFSTEGPSGEDSGWPELENLSNGKFYRPPGGSYIEFHFTIGEEEGTFYPDNWDFDAFERLFRNIEKSVYKESERN